jgi:hypothetical protein
MPTSQSQKRRALAATGPSRRHATPRALARPPRGGVSCHALQTDHLVEIPDEGAELGTVHRQPDRWARTGVHDVAGTRSISVHARMVASEFDSLVE